MSGMKALSTQFDTSGFSGAVATPTCSSCCCCCCCVATVVGGSIVTAKKIADEGERNQVPKSTLKRAVILAAVALPLATGAMIVGLFNFLGMMLPGGDIYTVLMIGMVVAGILLWMAARTAGVKKAGTWAIMMTIVWSVCFGVEVFGGVILLLQGGYFGLPLYGLAVLVAIMAASKARFGRTR